MDDKQMNNRNSGLAEGEATAWDRRLRGSGGLVAPLAVTVLLSCLLAGYGALASAATGTSGGSTQGSGPTTQSAQNGTSASKPKKSVDKRLPIPPAHEVRRANAKLQAYFQQHYPLDTNLAEYKFYHFLYKHYVLDGRGKHNPIMRYAALMLVTRLSPLQEDVPTTFGAIAALAREYRINQYQLMAKAAEAMIERGGMSIYTAESLLNNLASNAPKAMKAVHFRSAERMARAGITLARLTRQRQDLRMLIPVLTEARRALPLCKVYRRARRKLDVHPHDPAANTTVGLFLACFTSDTQRADAHLLRSGDPQLIALARKGTPNPDRGDLPNASGRKLMALADDWLQLSKRHHYYQFRRPLRALAKQTAEKGLQSIDSDVLLALKNDHYHQALNLLEDAQKMVSQLHLSGYSQRIAAWKADQKDLTVLRSKYRATIAAMNGGKSSAKAFQTIGEYLCFVGGRWKSGLAYLRRSGVSDLRQAASDDAKKPTTPGRQKSLGDLWWKISDKYTGLERYNIRLRAVYWYNLAKKKLHGEDLADVIYRDLTLKHETF